MNDRNYGHYLKKIVDIWSNGHGRTRGFQIKRIFGSFNLGIQEGIVNTFMRFIRFNASVK